MIALERNGWCEIEQGLDQSQRIVREALQGGANFIYYHHGETTDGFGSCSSHKLTLVSLCVPTQLAS